MLNLAAVLTLNNRAFFLRCFGLVFEHGEEPRRATRIARGWHVFLSAHPVGFLTFPSAGYGAWTLAPSALLVHFFRGVLIQQHIRRKTTRGVRFRGPVGGRTGQDGSRVLPVWSLAARVS